MAAVFLAHDLQVNRRMAIEDVPRGMSARTATVESVGVVLVVVTALSLRGGKGPRRRPLRRRQRLRPCGPCRTPGGRSRGPRLPGDSMAIGSGTASKAAGRWKVPRVDGDAEEALGRLQKRDHGFSRINKGDNHRIKLFWGYCNDGASRTRSFPRDLSGGHGRSCISDDPWFRSCSSRTPSLDGLNTEWARAFARTHSLYPAATRWS
jgi:hypothetical protein